jgi:hypothetical protein
MANNRFRIPDDVLEPIRERDSNCAYCGNEMVYPYERARARESATIEHLNREGPFYWGENGFLAVDIVICCGSCNSSRGRKLLADWFESSYCLERGIAAETVAEPVRDYLCRKSIAR